METKSGIEKRLSYRKPWRGKVVFEDERGDPLVYLYSENISATGIYLASQIPIQAGSNAFLSFTLPDGTEVRTIGEVVRIATDKAARKEEARRGMGIRFLDLTAEQRRRIESFCKA